MAVAILLALVVSLAGSATETELTATMDPTTISFPATREIEYRLTIATGHAAETLRIGLRVPAYGREIGGPKASGSLGSPIEIVGQPRLDGAGRIVAFRAGSLTSIGGVPPSECARGYDQPVGTSVNVEVPAGTTTQLVVRARTGRSAPFADTDYRLAFVVRGRFLRPDRPTVTGLRAVGVKLHLPQVRPTDDIAVVGRTTPPVPGRRVIVRYARMNELPKGVVYIEGPQFPWAYARPGVVARLRVNARGEFPTSIKPRRRGGFFVVWAFFPGRDSRYVPTRSCNAYLERG